MSAGFKEREFDEMESAVVIKRSHEAPPEVKENPFYDPEIWGRAESPDDVYLPESDEAISFSIAAHEVGHLIEEGKRLDTDLDNFEAVRAEEERAWNKGRLYIERHITEYFGDNKEYTSQIAEKFAVIRELMMGATDASKSLYVVEGSLQGLSGSEHQSLLTKRREELMKERGNEIMSLLNEVKAQQVGRSVDWQTFVTVVAGAIKDILRDNKKLEQD